MIKTFFLAVLPSLLPPVLVLSGLYFNIYLKGFYILHPLKTAKLMFSKDEKNKSPLAALSVSLAGALGVGNIVGVAVAIRLGGTGAIFWMWISAIVAAVLKYTEITLSVLYCKTMPDGSHYGGPMYYMRDGVKGRTGKTLAVIFSFLGLVFSLALGNAVQSNAAAEAVRLSSGIPKAVTGVVLALICALVVLGGFRGISRFTSVAVPVMSIIYIGMSLKIILSDIPGMLSAFETIIASAFSPEAAGGGIIGFILSPALRNGILKGTYSHEAGGGTAPMAYAQEGGENPARKGTLGIFEVVFDTLIMCTMTALVIIMSGGSGESGIALVTDSYAVFYGSAAQYIISVSVVIFAFSTIVCWAHYGRTCLEYFSRRAWINKAYTVLYCLSVAVGALISEGGVWQAADIAVSLMTICNMSALFILRKKVKCETEIVFFRKRRAASPSVPKGSFLNS